VTNLLALSGILATAFVVGLSGAMMPGPLLAVTIDETARRGAWAGPLLMLGHAVLEAALVVAIVLGFGRFLQAPLTVCIISFLGGIIMCWMGQGMLRTAGRQSLQEAPRGAPGRRLHPVAAGVVVSLSNPYWTIWWATIGMTYLVMGLRFGVVGIGVFFVGHICADVAWYSLVSIGVARGRRVLPDEAYQWMLRLCGGVLIVFGVWFFRTGVDAARGRPVGRENAPQQDANSKVTGDTERWSSAPLATCWPTESFRLRGYR